MIRVAVIDDEPLARSGVIARLHVGEHVYLLRESLHSLARQLDPLRFVRVHRSTIVREDRVAELQPLANRDAMLRLHDGTPLRVSRTYIDLLLARLRGAGAGAGTVRASGQRHRCVGGHRRADFKDQHNASAHRAHGRPQRLIAAPKVTLQLVLPRTRVAPAWSA